MDPRDPARSDDVACAACREPVTRDHARLVARRDDLAFVELHCPACASVTLGFLFTGSESSQPDAIRRAGARPITIEDVLDMRRHLAGWSGDVRSLLEPGPREPSGSDL